LRCQSRRSERSSDAALRSIIVIFAAGAQIAFAQPTSVMGNAPGRIDRALTEVASASAIRTRICAPRLDDGWVQ
jgi:hypothetical protein